MSNQGGAFLSRDDLDELQSRHWVIDPYDAKHLSNSAYELTVGDEAFTTDPKRQKQTSFDSSGSLKIAPGQMAILITAETLRIPPNILCLLSIRNRFKQKGIVNISGFHVDPGYHGRLKYTVYNASNKEVYIDRGEPLFCIWFAHLTSETSKPYPIENGCNSLNGNDKARLGGPLHSPAALNRRIRKLEQKAKFLHGLLIALLVGVILLVLQSLGSVIKNDIMDDQSTIIRKTKEVPSAADVTHSSKGQDASKTRSTTPTDSP